MAYTSECDGYPNFGFGEESGFDVQPNYTKTKLLQGTYRIFHRDFSTVQLCDFNASDGTGSKVSTKLHPTA